MKTTIKTCFLLILFCICSCNNNDESDNVSHHNLKSYTNVEDDYTYSCEYEQGLLSKATQQSGWINMPVNYKYNNDKKLIIKQVGNQRYLYSYDSQGRLVREAKEGTNEFISLNYLADKIVATKSYEDSNGIMSNFISELYTDPNGNVIKTVQITPRYSSDYLVHEFTYDSNNNIIQRSFKASANNSPDVIINFQYDTKKNPFYYSKKKIIESIYYLLLRDEVDVNEVVPNNIIGVSGSTSTSTSILIYNNDYPIQSTNSIYSNGSTMPSITVGHYEYY